MTTNALLLPKYLDYIVKKNFKVLISLDGDERGSSYRAYHDGSPAFKQVVEAALLVKNKYPVFFESNINFNAVLHDRNSVEDLYTFFETKFGKRPRIGEINTSGIDPAQTDEFKQMFKSKRASLFDGDRCSEIEEKLDFESPTFSSAFNYLFMKSPYMYMDYNELLFGRKNNRKEFPTGTCLPFSKKTFITVSGKILPCERISHKYYVGTLDERGVDINFEHVSETYNTYYEKVARTCSRCYDRDSCLCCLFHTGLLGNSSTVCRHFMNEEDDKRYLACQYDFFKRHPELYAEIMNNAEYY